jgi:iron(III) transport system substrate-binding protein
MKKTLRPRTALLAALILAPVFTLTAQAQSQSVNVICGTDLPWCDAAAREFTKKTGIQANSVRMPGGEALARIKAEKDNPKTDIWWAGTGDPFLQAAEENLLEAYRPSSYNQLETWSQNQYKISGDRVGGFYSGAIGFGVNTEALKKKNLPVPKCWADLLKPIYKGEIESSNPATSGGAYTIVAGLAQIMGEDKSFEYQKALHKNVVQYTRSSTAQAKNVARGEVSIGISFVHGFITEIENGFPVDVVVPCEGTSYEVGGIALIKGARNLENGKKFYDYMMSAEGQSLGATVKNYQQPANKTTPPNAKILQADKVKLVDYDFKKYGSSETRKQIIGRWEKEISAAAK